MRLPNGYGTVYNMGGKRRNPYVAKIIKEWKLRDDKAIPIYATLGYAPTKKDALDILAKYHNNPFDLTQASATFIDVYNAWSVVKFPSISHQNIKGYQAAFNACPSLHNLIFRNIKLIDLENAIKYCGKNYPTMKKMKTLFNQMYDYAISHDYCNKNYSEKLSISNYKDLNPNALDRTIFSRDEIDLLWENVDNAYIQVIIILIYTGLRITTLLNLKKEDVHLASNYIHIIKDKDTTQKQEKDTSRDVPICNEIKPLIEQWLNRSQCEYLLCSPSGEHFLYKNYYDSYFKRLLASLGMSHRPHDCRHTCLTMMKRAKIDDYYRRLIVGHTNKNDITNDVYTHVDIETLVEEINKIHQYR